MKKATGRPQARRDRLAVALLALALLLQLLPLSTADAAVNLISTAAGTGSGGYSGDGGAATSARLDLPQGVAVDASGNVYVADSANHVVRRITPAGTITTVAGTGVAGYTPGNKMATAARLDSPSDVAIDASGALYIADRNNERIRKVTATGRLATVAGNGNTGSGGDGAAATRAELNSPVGIAISPSGVLYIAEYGNHKIRRVDTSDDISTLAGTGTAGYSGDGGPASSARLRLPADIAVGTAGQVYIADGGNHRIRVVSASGTISTVAGTGVAGTSGNGGPAALAQINSPVGVTVDSGGNLLISEYGGHVIRRVTAGGIISTVGGTGVAGFSGDGGSASLAQLNAPARVALDGAGNLYIADSNNHRLRMIEALGRPDPPDVTGVSPASPAADNNPRVLGNAPAGSTITLYTNNTCTSAIAATGPANVFSSTGITVTVPPDSSTTFYATLTDAAAEISGCSSTSVSYVEDSTPPGAPNITASPGAIGTDVSPTWGYSTEAGASTQCKLERGAATIFAYATCSGSRTYDLSTQGDGDYTFTVRATDLAGNSGTESTSDYTLDTTAPGAPVITSSPGAMGNDVAPGWSFTSDPGTATSCRLERGATVIAGYAPCVSPHAYDLSTQPDGVYTFLVRATDPVGNPSSPATSTYELDTTTPGAPTFTSTPGATGTDTSPTWGFTGDAGASLGCRLSRGATILSGFSACTSPATFDLSTEVDGTYTLEVHATDAAGNTGADTISTYVLDRSAPGAPTITSSPGALGANLSPQWGFTTESGSTAECGLEFEGAVLRSFAPCTSPRTYNLSGEPDGTYTFLVRATDTAGNTGSVTSATYELDTTTPGVPTITSAPSAFSTDVTPTWGFTAESGSTTECRLERGGATISPYSNCVTTKTYDLSTEGDGTYTFSVRATDGAGNTGIPTSSTYTLDTSAPNAPTITAGPGALGNDTSPSWSFTGEVGAALECRLMRGGTMILDYTACSASAFYDLSAEIDGTSTFSVRATDAAGNTGAPATSDYTLDTSAPNAPTITAGPGAIGNDVTPSWSFNAEAGAIVECRLMRGVTMVSDYSSCSGSATYDLSAAVDATYTFSVRATDAAGNTGPAATSDYTLDTIRPNVPTITGGPGVTGSDVSPTWTFSSSPGTSTECRLEKAGTVIAALAPCISPHSYDLSASGDGSYTFSVRAVDVGGNVSFPTSVDYVLDTAPPPAPTITSSPGAVGNDTTPTWSFSGEAGATMDCRMERDTTLISDWSPCSGSYTSDLTASGDGTYTFSVRATDAAGNVGPAANDVYVLQANAPNAPTITSTPGALGNDTTPTWTFSRPGGTTAECRLRLGAATLSPYTACTSPVNYDLSLAADGGYTFSVRAVDSLGQASASSSSTYVLDTTAPNPPAFTAVPGALGNDATPRWHFIAETGAHLECRLETDTGTVFPLGTCSSPRVYDISARADDAYTFGVRATDAAGNVSSIATSTYVLDRTAPGAPTIVATPGASGSNTSPEWSFSAEAGAETQCALVVDGRTDSPFQPCTSPVGFDLPNERKHVTFLARALDAAGNVGPNASSDYMLIPEDGGVIPPIEPPVPLVLPDDPPPIQVTGFPPFPNTSGPDEPRPPGSPILPELDPGERETEPASGPLLNSFPRENLRAGSVLDEVGQVALGVLQRPAFPLMLILIVLLFLLLQNRMDRNDPKLAMAPAYGSSDLEFESPNNGGDES